MRKEKQFLLDDIKNKLAESENFLITSYQGLNPNTASNFRVTIGLNGGLFSVVKKTIFLKATEQIGIKIDKDALKGHIGIVYSGKDAVATTKAVYKFKKENDQLLDVLMGQFEGKMCDCYELKEIAALPSQQQMHAEFLGVFEASLSGFVSVLQGAITGVLSCMDQQVQKKESEK